MVIKKMEQPEALEIANDWKYDGEYAFYDMTADPEDYEEIVIPEKRGDRYFSVLDGDGLMGFFCVEREGANIEIGLGLRPSLTGRGRGGAFLEEVLRFVGKNYSFGKIRMDVASFNLRAIKVYERAGFVKTGTAKVSTNGGMYDFTQMELSR
ncbi:MAG: GNAT family N-acetyltransferase [Oscillospiraceae bacterium]|nr:GNAT family N-acetyltransferase [Oscillospiraceae bacterium]